MYTTTDIKPILQSNVWTISNVSMSVLPSYEPTIYVNIMIGVRDELGDIAWENYTINDTLAFSNYDDIFNATPAPGETVGEALLNAIGTKLKARGKIPSEATYEETPGGDAQMDGGA